ncbi:MAG: MFS transporter [Bdellovibrionaceae bacterium]|nr:MFS transporter [Pseudobdellovibrionaceae bacterium]
MSAQKIEKSLKLSNIDAFLCSLMVGAGESYLPAYVVAIGMGEIFAGYLATLPLVGGAVLQLFTPKILHRVNSHKYWVVLSAFIQALAFLPLLYFSLTKAPNFWVLFAVLTLYWGAGFSAGAAWNFWMGRLVPEERSAKYFSRRIRISQLGILVGIVGGGVALHNKVEVGPFTSVFSLLFLFAFACRAISSLVLSKKIFIKDWGLEDQAHRLRDSWNIFWRGQHKKKFFMYLVPFQMAVHVSSPFVAPYMLAQLKMNYGQYMVAIATMMVGKILSLSLIQNAKNNLDGFRLLIAGIVMVSPMAALWALSENYYFIIVLQLLSGLTWGCFEFGLSLIFFKDLKQQEKIPFLTVYNLLNSVAIIGGTLVGGQLLHFMGEYKHSYWILFAIGGGLRLVFCAPLIKQCFHWKSNSHGPKAANLARAS